MIFKTISEYDIICRAWGETQSMLYDEAIKRDRPSSEYADKLRAQSKELYQRIQEMNKERKEAGA